jgi:hypothetical protein
LSPEQLRALWITFGLCALAICLGAIVGCLCGLFGNYRNAEEIFPRSTLFALLCMLLGPIEAAIRRPKGTKPWRAAIICIVSAFYAAFLAVIDPFFQAAPGLHTLLITPLLGPLVFAMWWLIRERCVMGVVGITSFLCVAAEVMAFAAYDPCRVGLVVVYLE